MMSLFSALLLSVSIYLAAADIPDCTNCPYYNGIGYVKSADNCNVYFVCYKDPEDTYVYATMCCAQNLTFDEEHVTCVEDATCNDPRGLCPNSTFTTNLPCPYSADADPTKYSVPVGEGNFTLMSCPVGQIWDQLLCTCNFDLELGPPCDQILNYKFNDSYDSYSCNNFAVGEPNNGASLQGGVLCLSGAEQYVSIPYLNSWFAWNPSAYNFSFCLDVKPAEDLLTAGVFSTNCNFANEGSVAEITLISGELFVRLGLIDYPLGESPPSDQFSTVCVSYDNGDYVVYYNGVAVLTVSVNPTDNPVNSHSAATLGYAPGSVTPFFYGYIDNFTFSTSAI